MSPSDFTFRLTVPNDPDGVRVVTAMAAHAAEYANIDAGKGQAFVERVRVTAAHAFKSGSGASCLAIFCAANGELTVTVGAESASQSLSV
jgi:hypothetical protein